MSAKINDHSALARKKQEQMLKLVAKGFYNELINYGVAQPEILTIASHLLDQVMRLEQAPNEHGKFYNRYFTVDSVQDEWDPARAFSVDPVRIDPLANGAYDMVAGWLSDRVTRNSFVSLFPETRAGLEQYFNDPSRFYFLVSYRRDPVGIIGAENIDRNSGRVEMKKLIGRSDLRGKGIGKRATFAFLYYVFLIERFEKVYIHSTDINIRNLNLNSQFGFELEGIFMQEIPGESSRRDVVRMGLLRPTWLQIFCSPAG